MHSKNLIFTENGLTFRQLYHTQGWFWYQNLNSTAEPLFSNFFKSSARSSAANQVLSEVFGA